MPIKNKLLLNRQLKKKKINKCQCRYFSVGSKSSLFPIAQLVSDSSSEGHLYTLIFCNKTRIKMRSLNNLRKFTLQYYPRHLAEMLLRC